jgi:DNA invertase Pin-like site-specific DNA recombinase
MRVGLARVSTKKRSQDISIEGQVAQLEDAGCLRVLAERASAYSGKRRPAWEELWSLVASGTVTEVLVVDQSRLSRRGDDMEFLTACAVKGVKVKALTGGDIEVESYSGFVTAGLMSVLNQATSKLIGAKVKDGIRRRRAAGYLACGRVPFGYRVVDGKAMPDTDNWDEARGQFDSLMACGMNFSGWIRATGEDWTVTGLRHWINHPMLRGAVMGQWGQVEALITWQEWEQATRLRQARSTIRGRSAATQHLFTGLVRCDSCGRNMHTIMDGATQRLKCKNSACGWYGRGVKVAVARAYVIEALRTQAQALADLVQTTPTAEPAEALEIRARIARYQEDAANGVMGLEEAIQAQRDQLAALAGVQSGPRRDTLGAEFAAPGSLELLTDDELRGVTVEFIAAISYKGSPKSVSVTLR